MIQCSVALRCTCWSLLASISFIVEVYSASDSDRFRTVSRCSALRRSAEASGARDNQKATSAIRFNPAARKPLLSAP